MANVILNNEIEVYSVDITDFDNLFEIFYYKRFQNIITRCDFTDFLTEEENYPFLF